MPSAYFKDQNSGGIGMRKLFYFIAVFLMTMSFNALQAQNNDYMILTASNDPNGNELLVYDASGKLMQSVSTSGKGGVPAHATGGGVGKSDNLIAVVNYNSQSVSLFKKQSNGFRLVQVIPSISKPVSVAFGQNHLYILGTNTIESHRINNDAVNETPDGSSRLLVADGTGAQVGVLNNQLIISERSNMIELADLRNGAVTNNIKPVQLPPPPGNDTPVGLATREDIAYVTIAHSDKVGLVKNGKLVKVISSEDQHAPCWLTLSDNWLYCSNTPSKSITRYKVSDNDIAIDQLIAARTQGEPTDIDAMDGIVANLELGANGNALRVFKIDGNGNLNLVNTFPTAKNANGIAVIMMPSQMMMGPQMQ